MHHIVSIVEEYEACKIGHLTFNIQRFVCALLLVFQT